MADNGIGIADDQRQQPEVAERQLQEGQVDLQAVLLRMGGVEFDDAGQGRDRRAGFAVDRNRAERCHISRVTRQRDAAKADAMTRAEQHDAFDASVQPADPAIGAGGDRSRIDVAGVRHDERFGKRRPGRRIREQVRHRISENVRFAGIEQPRHGRRTNRGLHTDNLRAWMH